MKPTDAVRGIVGELVNRAITASPILSPAFLSWQAEINEHLEAIEDELAGWEMLHADVTEELEEGPRC